MRAVTALCVLLAFAGTASAAPLDEGPLTLDLTNWGYGVYYLSANLGHESNGQEGWQETPTLTLDGESPGDLVVLP